MLSAQDRLQSALEGLEPAESETDHDGNLEPEPEIVVPGEIENPLPPSHSDLTGALQTTMMCQRAAHSNQNSWNRRQSSKSAHPPHIALKLREMLCLNSQIVVF
jgi:hypothetical protein